MTSSKDDNFILLLKKVKEFNSSRSNIDSCLGCLARRKLNCDFYVKRKLNILITMNQSLIKVEYYCFESFTLWFYF